MNGFIKTINERQQSSPLGWRSRLKLEASFWSGLLVIGWETLPLPSLFVADTPPYAQWIAIGVAGIAMIMAIQVKRRLRKKLAVQAMPKEITAPNTLSLIDLLRGHGVPEFGSMYLYMPMPRRASHEAAWDWVETLQEGGLIKGEPWQYKADHVKDRIRQSHAELFGDGTEEFEIYRLDWKALNEIMGDELP